MARSIEKQGLLSPITVQRKANGRFALIAGQRRLLAFRQLNISYIPAIVRDSVSGADATAVSLVENLHRADMNPRDKATAFGSLLDKLGDLKSVGRETGVSQGTIRKYIKLLDLAPELQEKLAAGEARNTETLAKLAQRFKNPQRQLEVWEQIAGFRQDVQKTIIESVDDDLIDLSDLKHQAMEGAFECHIVRDCPYDCPTIPEPLKEQVADMIKARKIKMKRNRGGKGK